MGTVLIPAMLERGYPRAFVLGVVGASGAIGIVIPPSLPLILYGIVAEQSVPRLFLAGILPGLLQAAAFFVWVLYVARRRNFPVEPVLPLGERMRVTLTALPALLVPLVVIVGIYGGFVTVTEAAALSAVVSLCVSLFFYRGFHWTQTLSVVASGMRSATSIMLIIATALAVGHWVTESGAPTRFVEFLLGHQFATWQFLLAINALLLVLGCFLEVTATLLLVLPILAPALRPMGVDPVHFSIIFTHNMEIGLIHPPVGLNLFVLSSIAVAPMADVIRGILPFLVILLIVLAIITYVPVLTLWIPSAVFGQ
jgi:C4-dicarboxylate transporter DctM subunit